MKVWGKFLGLFCLGRLCQGNKCSTVCTFGSVSTGVMPLVTLPYLSSQPPPPCTTRRSFPDCTTRCPLPVKSRRGHRQSGSDDAHVSAFTDSNACLFTAFLRWISLHCFRPHHTQAVLNLDNQLSNVCTRD